MTGQSQAALTPGIPSTNLITRLACRCNRHREQRQSSASYYSVVLLQHGGGRGREEARDSGGDTPLVFGRLSKAEMLALVKEQVLHYSILHYFTRTAGIETEEAGQTRPEHSGTDQVLRHLLPLAARHLRLLRAHVPRPLHSGPRPRHPHRRLHREAGGVQGHPQSPSARRSTVQLCGVRL